MTTDPTVPVVTPGLPPVDGSPVVTPPGTTLPGTVLDPAPLPGDDGPGFPLPIVPPAPVTASSANIGMMSAGGSATAGPATSGGDAWVSGEGHSRSQAQSSRTGPAETDVVPAEALPHVGDAASAPVGLSPSGPTHSSSVAAGASGSVTCGGASASVLGLLESIFALGDDRGGDLGPLATARDFAWRLARQPGFAPD
ncbi:hypothetical protein [Microlunatus flavus]|uniref:hypothetical protein n=1 Tax=Microlunatus flavus TaxID=1036181 RepID=UPI001114197D|nr:hypothetical protein [Microlunatus flavus]